jgi:hypothetical protein
MPQNPRLAARWLRSDGGRGIAAVDGGGTVARLLGGTATLRRYA